MRGFTVEMSLIMPVSLLLIMSSILGVFYFHDKNIISGAAYETAVAGGTKAREKEGVSPAELEELFQDRVAGKCIFFPGAEVSVQVGKEEIGVSAQAAGRGMSVSVEKCVPVTEPETRIRDARRVKEFIDGTEDNH